MVNKSPVPAEENMSVKHKDSLCACLFYHTNFYGTDSFSYYVCFPFKQGISLIIEIWKVTLQI